MTPPYSVQTLAIAELHADERIQPRESLNLKTVADYATLYTEADPSELPLPPLDVFQVEACYYVADGFHRCEAAIRAGRTQVECHVYAGTMRDAMVHAALANVQRGLPYSFGDKSRILTRFLADPEMQTRSDRELARQLGISNAYVSTMRHRLEATTRIEATLLTVNTPNSSASPKDQQRLAAWLAVPEKTLQRALTTTKWSSSAGVVDHMARLMAKGQSEEEVREHTAALVERQAAKAGPVRRQPRPKPLSPEAQAQQEAARQAQALYWSLRIALRQLSTLEATPVAAVAMLSQDQKSELTEQLDRALTYLTDLKAAWPGLEQAPAQRSA
jgi:ParB-like chromosome segregation protein Spo0J